MSEKITEEKNVNNDKEFSIIVNSREKVWQNKSISYRDVVILAFESYSDDASTIYTITFSRGEESHKEGVLVNGEELKVKNGMVFNVTQTNKS